RRSSLVAGFSAQGQAEVKHRAAARVAAGADPAVMILDDLFTYGQAEAGALGLAVGGEGFEKAGSDLRRDSAAGIFDFGDDLPIRLFEAQCDFAAVRHRVAGAVDDVVVTVRQARPVYQQGGRRPPGLR